MDNCFKICLEKVQDASRWFLPQMKDGKAWQWRGMETRPERTQGAELQTRAVPGTQERIHMSPRKEVRGCLWDGPGRHERCRWGWESWVWRGHGAWWSRAEGFDSTVRGTEMMRALPESNWSSSRGCGSGWVHMEIYGTGLNPGEIRWAPDLGGSRGDGEEGSGIGRRISRFWRSRSRKDFSFHLCPQTRWGQQEEVKIVAVEHWKGKLQHNTEAGKENYRMFFSWGLLQLRGTIRDTRIMKAKHRISR